MLIIHLWSRIEWYMVLFRKWTHTGTVGQVYFWKFKFQIAAANESMTHTLKFSFFPFLLHHRTLDVRQETGDVGQETGDRRQDVRKEMWDRRRETWHEIGVWDRRHETGDRAWDRRCETGDVRQETGDGRQDVRLEMWDRRLETWDSWKHHAMKQNEKGILVKSSEKTRYFFGLSPLLVYVINGQWTFKKSSDIPLIVNQIKRKQ